MTTNLNWVDLLGKDLSYIVLRKENRLQLILRPTARQLRERGKRKWEVVAAGADTGAADGELPDEARGALLDALAGLAADTPKAVAEPPRKKRKKAAR